MRPERSPRPGTRATRPSLASQQAALMSMVTGRDFGAFTPDPAVLVAGDVRASAADRVHVYAHMYRSRFVEALESQFPRLAKHLGHDAFANLAAAYIDDEPSRHPSLRYVGEQLPAWLAVHRSDAPTLVGLATLEWARADIFDLVDDATLTLDEVRAWPPDRFGELPLHLVTAHRLVTVPPGTAALWDSVSPDIALASAAPALTTSATPETLLVWREGTIVCHRRLDAPEHHALNLGARGTQFGAVCELLLPNQSEETAIAQSYAWMSTWLADGMLRSAAPS